MIPGRGRMQDRMDSAFRLARDPVNAAELRVWIESERGTRFGNAYCGAFQSLGEVIDSVVARVQVELVL